MWFGRFVLICGCFSDFAQAQSLSDQNAALFRNLKDSHGYSDDEITKVKDIFEKSGFAGQGNPAVTKRPMTRDECVKKRKTAGAIDQNPEFEKICGSKYMAPLFDPQSQTAADAEACIDQF